MSQKHPGKSDVRGKQPAVHPALRQIHDLLYLNHRDTGKFYNPDKAWNADTLDGIADVVNQYIPRPTRAEMSTPSGSPTTTIRGQATPAEPAPEAHVILYINGGVGDVLFKPTGIAVIIVDYDVEGMGDPDQRQDKDPDGVPCCISEYPAVELIVNNPHWPIISRASKHAEPDTHLIAFLKNRAFVLITDSGNEKQPQVRYEAWAYRGPLDFDHASSVCFGLGADPHQALHALSVQLSRHSPTTPD